MAAPSSFPVITQFGSNTTYIDGTVTNNTAGTGIDKLTTSPTCKLVVGTLKVVTVSGASINAPLDTIQVVHSLATNVDSVPTIATISSITGSVAYTDPGVI